MSRVPLMEWICSAFFCLLQPPMPPKSPPQPSASSPSGIAWSAVQGAVTSVGGFLLVQWKEAPSISRRAAQVQFSEY